MSLIVDADAAFEGQQKFADGNVFPSLLMAQGEAKVEEAASWMGAQRERLLKEATKHGGLLFRGFPTRTVEDFDQVLEQLGLANFPYRESLSNAVRVNRTERVFSANEAPPEVQIYFHHEMAQTPLYPRFICFFCEVAAESGGATPLCRSDVLLERLRQECPEFVERCERKGLTYSNVMPGEDDALSGMGRSWKSTLGVETQEAAQARLDALGYKAEWLDDGSLRATTAPLPAIKSIEAGRQSFFNQLIAAYCGWSDDRNDPSKAIRHGDGSPLDDAAVKVAIELSEELTFDLQWQVGDFALLDNTVVMHARQTFTGRRKIWASLAEKQTHSFVVQE